MKLSSQEKQFLISLARFAIESNFYPNTSVPKFDFYSQIFNSKCGVFVTLTINKKLRGCIGYVFPDQKLTETVKDAAYQAAFFDPRFSPLTKEEFSNIIIEISILSEPFPLASYEEIVLGKHGLILEEGAHKSLLLPQVPIEHNMDKDSYLSALCTKAGLFEDYWKEKKLNLYGFTASVFSENDEGPK